MLIFVSGVVVLLVINYRLFQGRETGLFINYLAAHKFEFIAAGVITAYIPSHGVNIVRAICPTKACSGLILLSLIWAAIHKSPLGEKNPTWLFNLERSGYLGLLILLTLLVIIGSGIATEEKKQPIINRFLFWLGDRSYSIYLLHFPILAILWFLLYQINISLVAKAPIYNLSQFFLGGFLVLAASHGCYNRLETPFIKIGKKVSIETLDKTCL